MMLKKPFTRYALATALVLGATGATFAQANDPTATEAETDATVVPADEAAPQAGVPVVPQVSGGDPTETDLENDDNVVPADEATDGAMGSAPASGPSPTQTEAEGDDNLVGQPAGN